MCRDRKQISHFPGTDRGEWKIGIINGHESTFQVDEYVHYLDLVILVMISWVYTYLVVHFKYVLYVGQNSIIHEKVTIH